MTEQNTPSESDISVPAPDAAKSADFMVPKSRLDHQTAKLREAEEQISHMAGLMLSNIPENMKALIPTELSPAGQVAWYLRAKETGIFTNGVNVPETDSRKPTVTPREVDISTLPVYARMASGYNSLKG